MYVKTKEIQALGGIADFNGFDGQILCDRSFYRIKKLIHKLLPVFNRRKLAQRFGICGYGLGDLLPSDDDIDMVYACLLRGYPPVDLTVLFYSERGCLDDDLRVRLQD